MRTSQGFFNKCIECINPYTDSWLIKWNKRVELNDNNEEIVKWEEEVLTGKPTKEDLKKVIEGYYNKQTQDKILSGFKWEDKTVWLTQENQINYKSLYDLHSEQNTIKVNEDEYIIFTSFEEYKQFYLAVIEFIKNTLNQCWVQKDEFDYTPYLED